MSESRVRENRMHGSIGGRWPNREIRDSQVAYLTVPNVDRGTGQRQESELGHVCTRGDLHREFGVQSLGEAVKHAKAGDGAASFESSYG